MDGMTLDELIRELLLLRANSPELSSREVEVTACYARAVGRVLGVSAGKPEPFARSAPWIETDVMTG